MDGLVGSDDDDDEFPNFWVLFSAFFFRGGEMELICFFLRVVSLQIGCIWKKCPQCLFLETTTSSGRLTCLGGKKKRLTCGVREKPWVS